MKLARYLACLALIFVTVYAVGAFVSGIYNPLEWDVVGRAVYLAACVFIWAGLMVET